MASQTDPDAGQRQADRATAPALTGVLRAQRFERRSETLSALLLGLVAMATAWSGYQAACWGGEQSSRIQYRVQSLKG